MFVIPTGKRNFIYGSKMELVGSKKRSGFGGGRVKGSEVERGGMENRKIKAHGVFPSGHGITFL